MYKKSWFAVINFCDNEALANLAKFSWFTVSPIIKKFEAFKSANLFPENIQ